MLISNLEIVLKKQHHHPPSVQSCRSVSAEYAADFANTAGTGRLGFGHRSAIASRYGEALITIYITLR